MPLFGRKKLKGEVQEARELIKELESEEKVEPPKEEVKIEKKEMPATAPVFVKIDRYRQILRTMNYLKTTLSAVKSGISILNELDKLRDENLKMVKSAVEKIEQRIMNLDSDFMRPSGFSEEIPQLQGVDNLEITIDDLKGQIDQLKSEIDAIA